MRVYFDHNATTPVDSSVIDLMTRVFQQEFGNASSIHHFGQRAKGILDDARTAVADLLKAEVSEVVFTSGGTESDNFAIRGVADALEVTGRRHLIASAIEHEAVLNTFKALSVVAGRRPSCRWARAASSSRGPRGRHHRSDCARLGDARQQRNQDRPASGRAGSDRAHAWGLFHTDAVQSVGKLPVDARTLGADLLSLSAHKFNGPKGAGALWIKRGTRVAAILTGGKHERNRRAGTENVAAIAGLGAAAALASGKMTAEAARLSALRDRLENRSSPPSRIRPSTARATRAREHDEHQFRRRRSRIAIDRTRPRRRCSLDRVRVLLGNPGASHVLRAMGFPCTGRRTPFASASAPATRTNRWITWCRSCRQSWKSSARSREPEDNFEC